MKKSDFEFCDNTIEDIRFNLAQSLGGLNRTELINIIHQAHFKIKELKANFKSILELPE